VGVFGGFAGGETARDMRDVVANVAILSGDLLGNDTAGWGNRGDNAYHVVVGADNARLDGFLIHGGEAGGSGNEMQVNNVNLEFNLPSPLLNMSLLFATVAETLT
jgi:hypothetical protein